MCIIHEIATSSNGVVVVVVVLHERRSRLPVNGTARHLISSINPRRRCLAPGSGEIALSSNREKRRIPGIVYPRKARSISDYFKCSLVLLRKRRNVTVTSQTTHETFIRRFIKIYIINIYFLESNPNRFPGFPELFPTVQDSPLFFETPGYFGHPQIPQRCQSFLRRNNPTAFSIRNIYIQSKKCRTRKSVCVVLRTIPRKKNKKKVNRKKERELKITTKKIKKRNLEKGEERRKINHLEEKKEKRR